jgi:hypothetical protein
MDRMDRIENGHLVHVFSVSPSVVTTLGPDGPDQITLKDLGEGKGTESLQLYATDVFPYTSFAFIGSEFFGKS